MAVYGQLTGKPNDDPSPSPPGLPDTTPEDKGTRDGTIERSIDGRSQVSGTFASAHKEFRQVEGSQDQHMKWSPPSNYGKPASSPTPHFTAATSPTRARDFHWYTTDKFKYCWAKDTVQTRESKCRRRDHLYLAFKWKWTTWNALLWCFYTRLPKNTRGKKIRVITVIVIKGKNLCFCRVGKKQQYPQNNHSARLICGVYASSKFRELERSVNFESDSRRHFLFVDF